MSYNMNFQGSNNLFCQLLQAKFSMSFLNPIIQTTLATSTRFNTKQKLNTGCHGFRIPLPSQNGS